MPRKTAAQALIECTIDLLSDEERWTQGSMAKDANGLRVSQHEEEAVQFCILGAVEKCALGKSDSTIGKVEDAIIEVIKKKDKNWNHIHIPTWQDAAERTHQEIMEVLLEAKTLLSK